MNEPITEEIVLDYSNKNHFKEGVTVTLKKFELSNSLLRAELEKLNSAHVTMKNIAYCSVVANILFLTILII